MTSSEYSYDATIVGDGEVYVIVTSPEDGLVFDGIIDADSEQGAVDKVRENLNAIPGGTFETDVWNNNTSNFKIRRN